MLNFLLDFPMPYLKVVVGSIALCVGVVPNNMVAFNPLSYNVVHKWCDVYWEVGVFPILQKSEAVRSLLGVEEQVTIHLHV